MTAFTRLLLTVTLGIAASLPAMAQDVFHACSSKNYSMSLFSYANNEDETALVCKDSPKDLLGLLNEDAFRKLTPGYNSDPTAEIEAYINFNGTWLWIVSAEDGEGGYIANVAGGKLVNGEPGNDTIDGKFEAATRAEVLRQMVGFLKHNKDFQKMVAQNQTRETPNSPVAGPTGVIPSVVTAGYDSAMENTLSEITGNDAGTSLPINFAASYGHMRVGGRESNVATLPLSHTWRSTSQKGRLFNLNGSLVHVKQAGSTTYQGDLGAAYRLPVTDRWALTPSLRYAVSHSDDLIFATGVISAGLSSTYHIPYKKLDFVIGNMIGYHQTTDIIDLGKYTFDPKIKSWSARNGIMLAQPVNFFNVPLSIEYSLADSRYFGGTDFYVDNTQEVGLSIGTNRRADVTKRYLRLGLRYLHGRETHGFSLTGGYWF
jgi:hypothetical protein